MTRGKSFTAIATDEKLELINDNNKQLLDDFVEYLQSTDKSDGTVKGYISDIQIFYVWLLEKANNKNFTDITKRDIIKYQNYLVNELDCSPNRTRRLRAALSSLSNFIENILDDEFPNFRNIINKIPAPAKETVREKTVLEDEEIQELLDYLVDKKQYQKACVLALAWASGSRKSELLRFKLEYFKDENIMYGSLYKTPEKIKTKGRGKVGKLLNKYVLVNKFKPYLDLWVEKRKELGINDLEYLFVTKNSDGTYRNMDNTGALDNYAQQFTNKIGKPFYFHCMRHNFTTQLSKSGIPHHVIKEIVGWSSLDMVQLYDDQTVDDKIGDFFTEDGIKPQQTKSLNEL